MAKNQQPDLMSELSNILSPWDNAPVQEDNLAKTSVANTKPNTVQAEISQDEFKNQLLGVVDSNPIDYKPTFSLEEEESEVEEEAPKKEEPEPAEVKQTVSKEPATKEESRKPFTEEATKEVKESEEVSNKKVLTFLKSRGIIDLDEKETEDLEEDEAEDFIADKYEEAIEKRVEQTISSLPDDVKRIIRFANNGGSVEDYISQVYGVDATVAPTVKVDITKPEMQEKVMRASLLSEGYDEEFAKAQIDWLKETDKLEAMAKKAYEKFKRSEENQAKQLEEEQRRYKEEIKQRQAAFKKDLASHLSKTEAINSLKITKRDAAELPDYIANNSIRLQDGRQMSQFYYDLYKLMEDKNSIAVLAKLVKNKLSFKEIEKEIETNKTRDLKEKIRKTRVESTRQSKTLMDYLG